MSTAASGDSSTRSALQRVLFPVAAAAVTVLLFFAYGYLHREPDGAIPNRLQVDAQEKVAAKHAVELCWGRAKTMPAGSGEAQIASDACQQMQAQYEQTYRLVP